MTLDIGEFIRRFLIHVLPRGFHRIRHYGLFAGGAKADGIATARKLLGMPLPSISADASSTGAAGDDTLNPFVRALDPFVQISLFVKLKLVNCADFARAGKPRRVFV
jgi:hypothetical protein